MIIPIKQLTVDALYTLIRERGLPKFRAQQIYSWLYHHFASSYEDMLNLPAALRQVLSLEYPLTTPSVVDRQISSDGTRKYLLQYHDGVCVETVAIPSPHSRRLTVCFSTQAGCAMKCSFCATGKEGFSRNLGPGEIIDQVNMVQKDMGVRISNVVAMGQGEPFLNYPSVLCALRILNDPSGIAIGSRHITLSTCGIIPGIDQFSKEPEQFTLAISLHAARQAVRDQLMPSVKQFPLKKLKKVVHSYCTRTKRRVSFEYIMIKGTNDSQEDLLNLVSFCHGLSCHVNLIPLNAVPHSPFQPSTKKTLSSWVYFLKGQGIEVSLRSSRGVDIAGACGQLKNTFQKHDVSRETLIF